MDRRALLLALPLALGCTVQAPSVALTKVCSPPDAASCTFSATCDAQFIGTIAVDAAQSVQLFLAIEAANQAPKNGDTSGGRVNTADAWLQEIRISYAGPLAIPPAAHRIIQQVPANGTAVVAFPVMDVTATTLGGATEAIVVAKVKGKGVFGDGSEFETAEYEIPVKVCSGCAGAPPTCPAGEVLATCPGAWGQAPLSFACTGN
ncbi:MAG: hypothetical protein HZB56_09570 [Deltaproteobacteria bacterium]|nr:hypothetical protein [Deltaproteobacteria bacterium]